MVVHVHPQQLVRDRSASADVSQILFLAVGIAKGIPCAAEIAPEIGDERVGVIDHPAVADGDGLLGVRAVRFLGNEDVVVEAGVLRAQLVEALHHVRLHEDQLDVRIAGFLDAAHGLGAQCVELSVFPDVKTRDALLLDHIEDRFFEFVRDVIPHLSMAGKCAGDDLFLRHKKGLLILCVCYLKRADARFIVVLHIIFVNRGE